jgi:hypothetical protein
MTNLVEQLLEENQVTHLISSIKSEDGTTTIRVKPELNTNHHQTVEAILTAIKPLIENKYDLSITHEPDQIVIEVTPNEVNRDEHPLVKDQQYTIAITNSIGGTFPNTIPETTHLEEETTLFNRTRINLPPVKLKTGDVIFKQRTRIDNMASLVVGIRDMEVVTYSLINNQYNSTTYESIEDTLYKANQDAFIIATPFNQQTDTPPQTMTQTTTPKQDSKITTNPELTNIELMLDELNVLEFCSTETTTTEEGDDQVILTVTPKEKPQEDVLNKITNKLNENKYVFLVDVRPDSPKVEIHHKVGLRSHDFINQNGELSNETISEFNTPIPNPSERDTEIKLFKYDKTDIAPLTLHLGDIIIQTDNTRDEVKHTLILGVSNETVIVYDLKRGTYHSYHKEIMQDSLEQSKFNGNSIEIIPHAAQRYLVE